MSLFETKTLQSIGLAAMAASVLSLSSCQVRPLYSTDSDVGKSLAAIEFSEAESRVELEVRNSLIYLAGGGKGEPVKPEYTVDLTVKSRVIGVLLEMSSDMARAGRVEVSADYSLQRAGSDEVLKSGRRTAVALVDFPGQEFARLRAIHDAENRAARELAELIRADLAAALGR